MALVLSDRVKETTISTGTGAVTLGGALGGFQTFSTAIGNANTTYYVIENDTDWEVGIGTYTSASNSLSRDTVLDSTNSGSQLDLSGVSFVFCSIPADRALFKNASDKLTLDGVLTGDIAVDDITADDINAYTISAKDIHCSGDYTVHNFIGSGTITSSGLLTLRRNNAGNFLHAYVDDAYDRTIALYSDATSAPEWRLGLKSGPGSITEAPDYGYVYGEDGNAGLVANSLSSISITHGGGFGVTHKSDTMLTTTSDTGTSIYTHTASSPSMIVKGTSAQSADLQQWQNSSATVLACFNSDGHLGIGTDSPTYELDVAGDIGVSQYIYHNGDTNTYIRFRGDQIDFVAGGVTMLTLDEAGQDACVVNTGGQDIDFRVEGENDVNLIFVDAENDMVGIGTNEPAYKLDVVGHNAWARASGVIVGNSGIVLADNTPSVTTNTLYNAGGSLYFNGNDLTAGAAGDAKSWNVLANTASGVAISGWAAYANSASGVAVSGWASDSIAIADNAVSGTALATIAIVSGWAQYTNSVSGVAISGWASDSIAIGDTTISGWAGNTASIYDTAISGWANATFAGGGGDAKSWNVTANTASGVAISGWAAYANSASGVAVSGWASDTITIADNAVSGWATSNAQILDGSISGWAKAYVDVQDHSAAAVSGWAQYTNSVSGVAISGWASDTIAISDNAVSGTTMSTIAIVSGWAQYTNSVSGVAISGWASDSIAIGDTAVSGWAKAYVDGQDHTGGGGSSIDILANTASGVAISGWAQYTNSVSGVAISGWASDSIAIADNAVSGTVISTIAIVSGWAQYTNSVSGVAISGWASDSIAIGDTAVSGWATSNAQILDAAVSGTALGTTALVSGWATNTFSTGGGGGGDAKSWNVLANTVSGVAISGWAQYTNSVSGVAISGWASDSIAIADNAVSGTAMATAAIVSGWAQYTNSVSGVAISGWASDSIAIADNAVSGTALGTTALVSGWATNTFSTGGGGDAKSWNVLANTASGVAISGWAQYTNSVSGVAISGWASDSIAIADNAVSGTALGTTALVSGWATNTFSTSAGGVDAANGVNNRVATFTDADSLNGEANLTFDGSNLVVNGTLFATVKSFLIDHPTKEGMNLQYACLEGPENGAYTRGTIESNIIELPDYWVGLVDESSITVQLTPKEYSQPNLFVDRIENNKIYLCAEERINAYYIVHATRKDVNPLEVEWPK